MKITCGTDIIEIERIQRSIEKLGEKFLQTIFTEEEVAYCEARKAQKYQHYAARFAAKEAAFKALSGNLKGGMNWQLFEVKKEKDGKPKLDIKCHVKDLENVDISISHCKQYATANVVATWKEPAQFFDSHAHYNDEKFDEDRETVIQQIYNENITKMVCIGYDIESSQFAVKIADQYDFIYATVGISPNDIDNLQIAEIDKIRALAKNNKVVAIGEIGLDYYWNKENKKSQQEFFVKQIELADELDLPIVIHCRDAVMDTLEILKHRINPKKRGIFHCCMLNKELIKEAVKLGFYISFSGNITFKNAKAKEAIEEVPLDKILIETDSPYLTPEPLRGQRNDSQNVKLVAEKIAEIKGLKVEEIAKISYENAERIYQIQNKIYKEYKSFQKNVDNWKIL